MCFVFKQKTAYEMRISDWSSDVCSSDLRWVAALRAGLAAGAAVVAAALRWASDLDRNAVTFVALSGVFPRTSMRPPCLRKAVRSAAMVSLVRLRSEEHTSELQSLMRISYAVFCLKKKKHTAKSHTHTD